MRTPISLSIAVALVFLLLVPFCRAEDWTTKDGKRYKNIIVIRHDAVSVTIIDQDGEAIVPLASLPPDLQKRFDYDAKAAAALIAQKEAQADALKAQQEAQADAAKADEEQLQQLDALNAKAKADFDSMEKATVGGQVFLATKEGNIITLGLIHVYLFSEDQARAAMILLAEKATTATQGLQPTLDDQKAKCMELKDAVDAYHGDPDGDEFKILAQMYSDGFKQYRTTLAKYYHYFSQAYYITGLPAPLAEVETDADGTFSIQIPKTGSWVLGSYEHRKVMHKTESYFWLARVGKDAIARNKMFLSNKNLSTSGSSDSIVKIMDQSTIDDIIATADYLVKKHD